MNLVRVEFGASFFCGRLVDEKELFGESGQLSALFENIQNGAGSL